PTGVDDSSVIVAPITSSKTIVGLASPVAASIAICERCRLRTCLTYRPEAGSIPNIHASGYCVGFSGTVRPTQSGREGRLVFTRMFESEMSCAYVPGRPVMELASKASEA